MDKGVQEAASRLAEFGFNESEALVYCELLTAPGSTGYRIAHSIGKAPPNIYRTLGSLVQKGAAVVEDSAAKTYRAIPPGELVANLTTRFKERCSAVAAALEPLTVRRPEDRVYQIKTAEHAYQRAGHMMSRARELVLFDMFPDPLARLSPSLSAAAERGVRVAGKVYAEPTGLPTAVETSRLAGLNFQRWPGEQLTIVVDATEYLVALFDRDSGVLRHGFWTDSAYLSCLLHSGLTAELIASAAPRDARFTSLGLLKSSPPGFRALLPADSAEAPFLSQS